jgi:hypothetical protein
VDRVQESRDGWAPVLIAEGTTPGKGMEEGHECPHQGHTADEEAYAAFAVSDRVCAVSYLAASGNTLTVVLNMTSGEMYGFASNAERWFPGRGTFAMIR